MPPPLSVAEILVGCLGYVNGVFQTGFLYFGFGGVGNGGLERGWGRVGAGLGRGLGRGWGGGWGRVPHRHLEGVLVYTYFPSFSLENKVFGIHQTSFLPVVALEFSELKTPLVYTFFAPIVKQSTKQGNARGASEVRCGTSSIHFHCLAPWSSNHIGLRKMHFLPRPICRNVLEDFCCTNLEDFPGDFPGGFFFFWALFPTKMRRENPARKSAKKSGGSKIKIREKSVLPKAGPNILGFQGSGAL